MCIYRPTHCGLLTPVSAAGSKQLCFDFTKVCVLNLVSRSSFEHFTETVANKSLEQMNDSSQKVIQQKKISPRAVPKDVKTYPIFIYN